MTGVIKDRGIGQSDYGGRWRLFSSKDITDEIKRTV
jgi:hypothetical protein